MKKMWRPIDTRYLVVWLAFVAGCFLLIHVYVPIALPYALLAATTIAAFALFGFDKFQSIQRGERVPEKMLYVATFLGGSIGSLLGMNLFRHKTSKTSFQFVVILLILVQIGIAFFVWKNLSL